MKNRIFRFLYRKHSVNYFWCLRNKSKYSKFKILRWINIYKYNKLCTKFGASIPLDTTIKGRPYLPHGLNGIFISHGASIDENCIIYQQVTIGSNTLKDSKGRGAPNIGKNVLIGAGAKIIGNVNIGDNVRIGANCVVTKDIPSNCTVVLNGVRVILHDIIKNNTFQTYKTLDK